MPVAKPESEAGRSDWTKPLRNAARLAAGRGVQAVCSLIYLGVAARALGGADFGALVLIHALALSIARFSSFGSKEMLVRFGSLAIAGGDDDRLRRLVWHGIFLDSLGTALAWVCMGVLSHFALQWFALPEALHTLTLAYWFAAVAVMNLSVTSLGILRLFDRFQLIAYQSTIEPLIRLAAALLMYYLHGSLHGFLLGWFVALLAGRLSLIALARRTLRGHSLASLRRPTLRQVLKPEAHIWRFIFGVQWTTTIDLVDTQLPLLAVGGVGNTLSAGLFKVAQQITAILDRANSKLIVPSLYTELSRMNAEQATGARRHMVIRLTAAMMAVALCLFLLLLSLGKPLLVLIAGQDFVAAYPVMLWLAAQGVVGTLSVTLEPLLMAAGQVRVIVIAGSLPLIIYVPMIFGLIGPGGLSGIGPAMFVYSVLNVAILVIGARRTLRQRITP